MINFRSLIANRRVFWGVVVLIIAAATNTWHKNIVSGVVLLIDVLALAIYLADYFARGEHTP